MIKNIVFRGGGVLGIAYGGFLQELKNFNKLKDLEQVAGTSAGSIVAALLALGYTPEEIYDITFHTDFSKFEDRENPTRLVTKYGIYSGDAFLEWMREKVTRKGFATADTFADLERFNLPKLHVFATDLNTLSIKHFCYDKTPDVPIAEAVRASMSIPFFFKAYKFENSKADGHIYVDGGAMWNYPLQVFDQKGTNKETLGLFLGNLNEKPTANNLDFNQPVKYIQTLFDCIMNAQDSILTQQKEDFDRTVTIDTLVISATNFKITEIDKHNLYSSGKIAAANWIKNQ